MDTTTSFAALSAAPIALVQRADVNDAVTRVSRVIQGKDESYRQISLVGTGSALRVMAQTDFMQHTIIIAAPADSRFKVAADGLNLKRVLTANKSDLLELRAENDRLVLDFEGTTPSLPVFPRNLPSGPGAMQPEDIVSFTLSAKEFGSRLESVLSSISSEETRYYLNGAFMHMAMGEIHLVSTDGHRLTKRSMAAPANLDDIPAVIIPHQAVKALARECTRRGAAADIQISMDKMRALFTIGNSQIYTGMVDGCFPDYGRVVPRSNPHRIEVNRKDMLSSLNSVSSVLGARGAVKLEIERVDADKALIQLSCRTADGEGVAQCTMVGVAAGDDPEWGITIGFNARYVKEMLKDMDCEAVAIDFNDPGAPTLFTDAAGSDYTGVLMPMRV